MLIKLTKGWSAHQAGTILELGRGQAELLIARGIAVELTQVDAPTVDGPTVDVPTIDVPDQGADVEDKAMHGPVQTRQRTPQRRR